MFTHKCLSLIKFGQTLSYSRRKLWGVRHFYLTSAWTSNDAASKFDVKLLEILACPLSKKPLRYDETNNELVCDEIGVAYPIIDGIPNLNPVDGRLLKGEAGNPLSHFKS